MVFWRMLMKYMVESEIRKDGSKIYYDIYVAQARKTPGLISPPHIHTYYEIVYATGGDIQFQFGEEVCQLHEYDIIIVYPNTAHGTTLPKQANDDIPVSQHVVKFSPTFLYPMNPVPTDIQHLLLPLQFEGTHAILRHGTPMHREIFRLLTQIHQEAQDKEPGYEIALRAHFSMIYTHLIRRMAVQEELQEIPSEAGKENSALIYRALTYVEEHYQEPISMQQVAQECNVNYYHFSRLFQQYTHQGFRDYIVNFRINKARKMLLQTNDSVTSIAIECGFETISYFIKKFQAVTGMTPKNFRKQFMYLQPASPDARENYDELLHQKQS